MCTEQSTPIQLSPLLVRIEDAARMLGLGRTTVNKMIAVGELPVVRYGAARRISMAALKVWIEEHTQIDGNQV